MSGLKLSDPGIAAVSSLSLTDLFYTVQASGVGGKRATLAQLKTLLESSFLGLTATAADSSKLGGTAAASYALASDLSSYLTSATAASTYQTILVSGTSLKTINSASLLGSGNVTLATLGANTFTSLQTITVGAANTGVLASTGYSLTGSDATSMVNLAGTWNTSGTPTAIKLNVTDTASNSASLLMDLQVGGSSKFTFRKDGLFQIRGGTGLMSDTSQLYVVGAGQNFFSFRSYTVVTLGDGTALGWTNSSLDAKGGTVDVLLTRDGGAGMLAQRNGANAQTFRTYRSYTDASNYSRLSHAWNTSTALVMAEGAGTGTDGSVAFNDAALATNATVGFVMVPSCAGTPSGTPADIPTGQIPLVWDSTNLKLYAYTGGAWKSSAAFT